MTVDPIPFQKPKVKARLALPNKEDRAYMIDQLLEAVVRIEADPEFVGFSIVAQMADGRAIAHWRAMQPAEVQLVKNVRRHAAEIAESARKPFE